jgi:hypothetical protein
MKTAIVLAALFGGTQAEIPMSKPADDTQLTATCFKSGEQRSGMNKICYYNCMGSQAAITISSTSLCPLSINR